MTNKYDKALNMQGLQTKSGIFATEYYSEIKQALTLASKLEEHKDALQALVDAGDKANPEEWLITREVIDIDYYNAVRAKGACDDLALFCYSDGDFPMPNYSDKDAEFVAKAANTRPLLKELLAITEDAG